jgi:hypothetical protein
VNFVYQSERGNVLLTAGHWRISLFCRGVIL